MDSLLGHFHTTVQTITLAGRKVGGLWDHFKWSVCPVDSESEVRTYFTKIIPFCLHHPLPSLSMVSSKTIVTLLSILLSTSIVHCLPLMLPNAQVWNLGALVNCLPRLSTLLDTALHWQITHGSVDLHGGSNMLAILTLTYCCVFILFAPQPLKQKWVEYPRGVGSSLHCNALQLKLLCGGGADVKCYQGLGFSNASR